MGVMAVDQGLFARGLSSRGVVRDLVGILRPKFGALILTMPLSVLGGVTTILFGLIAVRRRTLVEARSISVSIRT